MVAETQIITLIVFLITYALIFSEKLHRATAATAGAAVMVIIGMYYGFLTQEEALRMIDFNVIVLLLGMMMIVGVLLPTGFFEFLGIKCAKISKGNLWYMIILLGAVTTILSMFIDNVTTILIIAPVTIKVAEKLNVSPIPLLLCEALLSDVGGVATLVGDPPNVMIASAAGFTFDDFLIHLLPIVIVALMVSLFTLKYIFRDYYKIKPKNVKELMAMDEYREIRDWSTLKRTLPVLGLTIFLFLIHHRIGLSPASVGIIGGILALLVSGSDPHKVLDEVEWPTLMFFAGLFILVGTIDKVGILTIIASKVIAWSNGDFLLATMYVLWIAAFASAAVDNIPFTAAMIPVIAHMGEMGMAINPVWWGLAMGVGFGANGTTIGSSANVITVGISEKYGHPITFMKWLKTGIPVMMVSTIVGSVFILLFTEFLF